MQSGSNGDQKTGKFLWVGIETTDYHPRHIDNLLWLPRKSQSTIPNLITTHSLRLWDACKTLYPLQSTYNPLLPFIDNPEFYPAWTSPNSFAPWTSSNITKMYHLTTVQGIKPFQTLYKNHSLPTNEQFQYLQVKNFKQMYYWVL